MKPSIFRVVLANATYGDDHFGDAINGISVTGTYGGDTLRGGTGNDQLNGGAGDDRIETDCDDTLEGGAGDDRLWAGAGDGLLAGGDGSDTFGFGAIWGADTISDFDLDEDFLQFFGRLLSLGV